MPDVVAPSSTTLDLDRPMSFAGIPRLSTAASTPSDSGTTVSATKRLNSGSERIIILWFLNQSAEYPCAV